MDTQGWVTLIAAITASITTIIGAIAAVIAASHGAQNSVKLDGLKATTDQHTVALAATGVDIARTEGRSETAAAPAKE